jgi:anti-sigma factor RsiW
MPSCDEVLESIEPIAAGDLTPDDRTTAHLAACARCAGTLEDARRLEHLLRSRPTHNAPAQFTTHTLARIRRDRWRREQFLDTGFNAAIALVVLGAVVAVWMAMDRSGLAAVSGDIFDLFGAQLVAIARQIAPSLPLYAGAVALVATALAIWWWAERDVTF